MKKPNPAGGRRGLAEFRLAPVRLHATLERIAESYAVTLYVVAGKFKVVLDVVEMRFRAEEDVVPNIQTEAASPVRGKMLAAREIRAAEEIAGGKWLVKADIQPTNSSLQLSLRVLSQRGRKDGVEVVKYRTIRLEEPVYVLVGAPSNFTADPDVLLPEQEVPAEGWIAAAADGHRRMPRLSIRYRRSCYRAPAKADIKLLSLGGACDREKSARGRNEQQ